MSEAARRERQQRRQDRADSLLVVTRYWRERRWYLRHERGWLPFPTSVAQLIHKGGKP